MNIACLYCRGQKKQALINDLSVTLHEETVNKVLTALGDISGRNKYEVMLVKGTYTWTIQNPKINIRPDSSFFTCDALVKVGSLSYKSNVVGDVKIDYNADQNQIVIRITRAVFELYTIVMRKKIHIKDVHLEDRFKDPFIFEGPRTASKMMEFPMPDSTVKRVIMQPTNCIMELRWKEIYTACEVSASEVKSNFNVAIPSQKPPAAATQSTADPKK